MKLPYLGWGQKGKVKKGLLSKTATKAFSDQYAQAEEALLLAGELRSEIEQLNSTYESVFGKPYFKVSFEPFKPESALPKIDPVIFYIEAEGNEICRVSIDPQKKNIHVLADSFRFDEADMAVKKMQQTLLQVQPFAEEVVRHMVGQNFAVTGEGDLVKKEPQPTPKKVAALPAPSAAAQEPEQPAKPAAVAAPPPPSV